MAIAMIRKKEASTRATIETLKYFGLGPVFMISIIFHSKSLSELTVTTNMSQKPLYGNL